MYFPIFEILCGVFVCIRYSELDLEQNRVGIGMMKPDLLKLSAT